MEGTRNSIMHKLLDEEFGKGCYCDEIIDYV
jgi:hypothetical protein